MRACARVAGSAPAVAANAETPLRVLQGGPPPAGVWSHAAAAGAQQHQAARAGTASRTRGVRVRASGVLAEAEIRGRVECCADEGPLGGAVTGR
ncbi:hypothetical protein GCM10027440_06380 [Nocardiopsis coralliicola]